MKLAVTDANIFIDLIHTELIGYLFELGYEIHTSVEVFGELNHEQQVILIGFQSVQKLTLHSFTEADRNQIELGQFPSKLSSTDISVIYLAEKMGAMILTGDNVLRVYCETKHLEVHGTIWFFDQIVEKELTTKKMAADKLQALINYNARLPKAECDRRIEEWNEYET